MNTDQELAKFRDDFDTLIQGVESPAKELIVEIVQRSREVGENRHDTVIKMIQRLAEEVNDLYKELDQQQED